MDDCAVVPTACYPVLVAAVVWVPNQLLQQFVTSNYLLTPAAQFLWESWVVAISTPPAYPSVFPSCLNVPIINEISIFHRFQDHIRTFETPATDHYTLLIVNSFQHFTWYSKSGAHLWKIERLILLSPC